MDDREEEIRKLKDKVLDTYEQVLERHKTMVSNYNEVSHDTGTLIMCNQLHLNNKLLLSILEALYADK